MREAILKEGEGEGKIRKAVSKGIPFGTEEIPCFYA